MATAVFSSFEQICDNNGDPLSGALVYVYQAETTTLVTLYPNDDLTGSASNPIECDAYGRHDMRYLDELTYKVVVKTSAGVTVFTRDNIDAGLPAGTGVLAIAKGGTGADSAAGAVASLGAATADEVADIAAQVASLAGAAASTEATHIATGSTAQRAAVPSEGDIRRNTTTHRYEGYNQSSAFEQFLTDTEIATTNEALAGSDNTKVMTPAKVRAANAFQSALLHVQDQKASGTDGGTFTSGAWRTRTLNTVLTNEISGASLGSNQITLPAGTYYIEAWATGFGVDQHKAKLRNTTDSTDTLIGTNSRSGGTNTSTTLSNICGRFTIAAQKVFEIQHQCTTTRSTTGFGEALSYSVVEVYSGARIFKVA